MADIPAGEVPQAAVDRFAALLRPIVEQEVQRMARLLAGCGDGQLLGAGEFALRDVVHRLGARALEVALADRKKGATAAPPPLARTVRKARASKATGPSR